MRKTRKANRPSLDIMEHVRGAAALANALPPSDYADDFKLEAFMGIFHPKKQADRAYMARLKNGRRRP